MSGERTPTSITLSYAPATNARKWPVWIILAQLLTPVVAAALARIISNELQSNWGSSYPSPSQRAQHLHLAENVPFFVGSGLLLLTTVIGIVRGVRSSRSWVPVLLCAPIAFIILMFALVFAVPWY